MKYMMMMHTPRGTGDYEIHHWPPEDVEAHMAFLNRFNRELVEAGEWVDVLALTPPGEAKLVRAGRDGAPVTDGPFPEAKEFLAGFWIVDVDSPERAYELAAKASAAPGPGGVLLNTAIEVRRVMSGPPEDA
ncbi:MAG TPA: YciI family protein [Longimicrobiaceae bacterium]|nr:YciI family protein [Longimicrobiaceae bacterium]